MSGGVLKKGKEVKAATLSILKEVFSQALSVVVVSHTGLTSSQLASFRQSGRLKGVSYIVSKNTLFRLAARGTDYENLIPLFKGVRAIAYSTQDSIAPAAVVVEFAKSFSNLEVVGAGLGCTVLDVAQINALASLPSLSELRARLLGGIAAPASKLVRTVAEPSVALLRLISAKYGV